MSKQTSSKPIVISIADWNPSAVRYTPPKELASGSKSINVVSAQTGRWIHLSTPLMMTWGVSDYTDDKGESNGRFSMDLNFPNADYANKQTDEFLEKIKAFENQILDDAVKYSEVWFGEEMSREVVKHTFNPLLKYRKDKVTKKIDFTKPPSLKAKVPVYDNNWQIEIYDSKNTLIFPVKERPDFTPMDFIPKLSKVASVIQCAGLWFAGKGWGVTWKLTQCVVKPQENLTVFGKCHVMLTDDDIQALDSQPVDSDMVEHEDNDSVVKPSTSVMNTEVEDSDAEEEEEQEEQVSVVKKVVKKAVAVSSSEVAVAAAAETAVEPAKKKVVKKKV